MVRERQGQGSSCLVEMEDGFLVRVPEEKRQAWEQADHKAPLTPAEQRFKERLVASFYGAKQ